MRVREYMEREKLLRLRYAKLLTQRELALLSGVEQPLLDSYERGEKNLDSNQIEAIQEALDKWDGGSVVE